MFERHSFIAVYCCNRMFCSMSRKLYTLQTIWLLFCILNILNARYGIVIQYHYIFPLWFNDETQYGSSQRSASKFKFYFVLHNVGYDIKIAGMAISTSHVYISLYLKRSVKKSNPWIYILSQTWYLDWFVKMLLKRSKKQTEFEFRI